jgi:hypothetical protein
MLGAPAAAAWEPLGGAVFNNPNGTLAEQWRVLHTVEQAIRNAPSGSRVLLSTFLFDIPTVAEALVEAHARQVRVQVVLDGDDADTPESRLVASVVNDDNIDPETGEPPVDAEGNELPWGPDHSFVVFCEGSCRGEGGSTNNHSKFYLFSQTGTARHVVMTSSSNLNQAGAVRGWNDLYVVKGRPGMFSDFAAIHAEMAEDTSGDDDPFREFVREPFTYRFFPTTGDRDPRLEDLSRVECRGATDGAGLNGRTTINVAMFAWGGERGKLLAERLVELDNLGCDVSVIYGAPRKEVADILKTSARQSGIKLWDSRVDQDRDGVVDVRVHQKYTLISGVYAGDTSSWRVHAGSLNWQGALQQGDDFSINIARRATHLQYLDNWQYIAMYGARRIR